MTNSWLRSDLSRTCSHTSSVARASVCSMEPMPMASCIARELNTESAAWLRLAMPATDGMVSCCSSTIEPRKRPSPPSPPLPSPLLASPLPLARLTVPHCVMVLWMCGLMRKMETSRVVRNTSSLLKSAMWDSEELPRLNAPLTLPRPAESPRLHADCSIIWDSEVIIVEDAVASYLASSSMYAVGGMPTSPIWVNSADRRGGAGASRRGVSGACRARIKQTRRTNTYRACNARTRAHRPRHRSPCRQRGGPGCR